MGDKEGGASGVREGGSWVVPSRGQEAPRWSRGQPESGQVPASRMRPALGASGLGPLCGRRPRPWVLPPAGWELAPPVLTAGEASGRRRFQAPLLVTAALAPSSALSCPWRQRWTCGSSCASAPMSGATWTSEACPGEPCSRPRLFGSKSEQRVSLGFLGVLLVRASRPFRFMT